MPDLLDRMRARAFYFEGEPECCRDCVNSTGSITLELPGTTRRKYRPHPGCNCLVSLIRAEVEIELGEWSTIPLPNDVVQDNSLRIENCRTGAPYNLSPYGTVLPSVMTVSMKQFGRDEHNFPPGVSENILSAWQPTRGEPQTAMVSAEQGTIVEAFFVLHRSWTYFPCQLTYVFYRAGTMDRIGEIKRQETFKYDAIHSLDYLADQTVEAPCNIKLHWEA